MDKPDDFLVEQLRKLKEKYAVLGQDLSSYLDGLLYSDYLTYWEYIHLDTLLSLQTPRTPFPDERIFITYHQITELYFNLVLWEMDQATEGTPSAEKFILHLDRINRYFQQLEGSFDIMIEGMDPDQFHKFRMALLPSSGFQSVQYRLIELAATDVINLVHPDEREALRDEADLTRLMKSLYWKRGAVEIATQRKTLTLRRFEERYEDRLLTHATRYRDRNLQQVYLRHFQANAAVGERLRELDALANVRWPLAHLKSVGRYLEKDQAVLKATGGTNWQKFLPPNFQRIVYFPTLWTAAEKEAWGKAPRRDSEAR